MSAGDEIPVTVVKVAPRDAGDEHYPEGVTAFERRVLNAVRRVAGLALPEEARLLEELRPLLAGDEIKRRAATSAPELTLETVAKRLRCFGIAIGEPHEGGFSIYWPLRNYGQRNFDTLDEVDEWAREELPLLKLNEAQSVLDGVSEIVRLLDSDSAENCNDTSAVVSAIVRELEAGRAALQDVEAMRFTRRAGA